MKKLRGLVVVKFMFLSHLSGDEVFAFLGFMVNRFLSHLSGDEGI